MKIYFKRGTIPAMALLCLLFACSSADYSADTEFPTADSVAYAYNPDSTSDRLNVMLIRNVEIKFKVQNIHEASQKIARIASQTGGEVWNSNLHSDVENVITKKISADSLLEVTTYRQANEMRLRIPTANLDSAIASIIELSALTDYVRCTTDDVSLEYLSNDLKSKNMANTQKRHKDNMAIKKSSLEKYTAAECVNAELQENVIDKQIQNMRIEDKVNYSTITLSIYQDIKAHRSVLPNFNEDRFEPSFISSIGMAAQDGWGFMLFLLIFIIRVWPLYLLTIVAFGLWRWYANQPSNNRLIAGAKK